MNKFNFKLQKVLEFRETIQDEKTVTYNRTQNQLKKAEQKLADYQDEINELLEMRDQNSKKTNVYALKQYQTYIEKKYQEIDAQVSRVNSIKKAVKQAKQDLIEATKEKMALEKLREQYQEVYRINALKEEEKFVDQIISFKNTMK